MMNPFCSLVERGDLEALIWLFQSSTSRLTVRFCNTLFSLAVVNDHLHICKWLMTVKFLRFDPAIHESWLFCLAATKGHLQMCKWLAKLPEIDITTRNGYPLIIAAEKGHLDVCRWFLSLPKEFVVNPAVEDNIIFRDAAEKGHLDTCKWLLSLPKEFGIDPAAKDNYAFKWAALCGHFDLCKWLLSLPKYYGIDPGSYDKWAFQQACMGIKYNVGLWLSSFSEIDPTSPIPDWTLYFAIEYEQRIDICEWLWSFMDKSIVNRERCLLYAHSCRNPAPMVKWIKETIS